MASDLRSSGFVRETRGPNGQLIYRIWATEDRVYQYTAPKHQDAAALERSRTYACTELQRQMSEAGLTLADLIPPTDPRGVTLK